jgi:(p)ppGpp synthase/HD superfamily hydrolase
MEQQALLFATRKHEGKVRKFNGEPYITHPIRVRDLVKEFSQDETLLCAALLHDTVEDTDTTNNELRNIFGWKIADMVYDLTNQKDLVAEFGKTEYIAQKMNHIPLESLLVKLADRLDNVSDLSSIDEDRKKWSAGYAKQTDYILECLNVERLNENHRELVRRIREKIGPFI